MNLGTVEQHILETRLALWTVVNYCQNTANTVAKYERQAKSNQIAKMQKLMGFPAS